MKIHLEKAIGEPHPPPFPTIVLSRMAKWPVPVRDRSLPDPYHTPARYAMGVNLGRQYHNFVGYSTIAQPLWREAFISTRLTFGIAAYRSYSSSTPMQLFLSAALAPCSMAWSYISIRRALKPQ